MDLEYFLDEIEFKSLEEELDSLNIDIELGFQDIIEKSNRLIDTKFFKDSSLTYDFIWLFHQLRLNPDKFDKPYQSFITLLQRYSDLGHNIPDQERHYQKIINSLIFLVMLRIKDENLDANVSLEGCLSLKERNEIDYKILSYEEEKYLDEKALNIEDSPQINILNRFKDLPAFKKTLFQIKSLMDVATSDSEMATIAEAPINYLLDINDVVPDDIGIFGLVDDLYAIEKGFHKIQEHTDFYELVTKHNRDFPDFQLPTINSSSGDLSLVNVEDIVKASYTKLSEEYLKRVLVMPDVGPLGVLCALGNSITDRLTVSRNTVPQELREFTKGEKFYFGDLTKGNRVIKIVGSYEGKVKRHNAKDLHWVGFSKGNRLTFSGNELNNAQAVGLDTDISKEKDASKYKHMSGEAMPWPEATFSNNINQKESLGRILIIGKKAQTLEFLKEEFLGKSIESWLGVRYISKKYTVENFVSENQLFPEPQIYLISDKEIASEILSDDWSEEINDISTKFSLVICAEDSFLSDEYFSMSLGQAQADTLVFIEFFSPYSDQLKKVGFQELAVMADKIHSQEFIEAKTGLQKFFNRSSPFDIIIKNFEEDELIDSLQEMRKLIKEEETFYLKFQYFGLISEIQKRILPINYSQDSENKFIEKLNNLKKELKFQVQFYDDLSKILKLLEDKEEDILNFSRLSALEELLENEIEGSSVILVDKAQIDPLNDYLLSKGFKSSAKLFTNLEISKKVDNLIVPSFFNKKTAQKLRNFRYSDKHIFLLSKRERKIHKIMDKYEKTLFQKYYSSKKVEEIEEIEELESLDLELAYEINEANPFQEFLNLTIQNAQITYKSKNEHQNTDAKLFVLDTFKLLMLPSKGKTLRLSSGNNPNVEVVQVNEIKLDDRIAISKDVGGNDLLQLTLRGNEENYKQYREIEERAKSWQLELKRYVEEGKINLEELVSKLEEYGIYRNPLTIKSWLNDPETVAPQKKEESIKKIFSLVSRSPEEAEECIKATSLIYKLRAEAHKNLIDILSHQRVVAEADELSIEINKSVVTFSIYSINSASDVSVEPRYLYRLIDQNKLNN